jgi:hypothetical protein
MSEHHNSCLMLPCLPTPAWLTEEWLSRIICWDSIWLIKLHMVTARRSPICRYIAVPHPTNNGLHLQFPIMYLRLCLPPNKWKKLRPLTPMFQGLSNPSWVCETRSKPWWSKKECPASTSQNITKRIYDKGDLLYFWYVYSSVYITHTVVVLWIVNWTTCWTDIAGFAAQRASQFIAVPKARTKNFLFGMFCKEWPGPQSVLHGFGWNYAR